MQKFNFFKNPFKKNKKGFLILFAIILSSIILTVALSLSDVAFNKVLFSASSKNSSEAFSAADIGVECALFYDLNINGSLFGNPSSTNVECAGNVLDISAPAGPWTLFLNDLGPTGEACAIVKVEKVTTPVEDTIIISKGYNKGGKSNCIYSNLKRVEREIEVSARDVAGAGVFDPDSAGLTVNNSSGLITRVVSDIPGVEGGIDCSGRGILGDIGCFDLYELLDPAVEVTLSLTDIPPGYTPVWSGPCLGVDPINLPTCRLSMDGVKTVNFSFSNPTTYTVNAIISNPLYGSVDESEKQVIKDDYVDFTLNPNTNYSVSSSVQKNPSDCPSGTFNGTTYRAGPITKGCDYTFSFVLSSYTVSTNGSFGGSISPNIKNGITINSTTYFDFFTYSGYGLDLGNISGTCPLGSLSLSGDPVYNRRYTTGNITENCIVYFDFTRFNTLSVSKTGTGTGSVTAFDPLGTLSCGTACSSSSYDYATNTDVLLRAVANSDSTFTGWSGGICSGTGDCNVTMDQANDVIANFELFCAIRSGYTNNGLVVDLDAGNSDSYPGNGNVWYNLVSGANATLFGSPFPSYDSSLNGFIEYSGNQYADFNAGTLSNTVTVEMWAKYKDMDTGKMAFGWNTYDVWTNGGKLGFNTYNNDLFGINSDTVTALGLENQWKHYVYVMNANSYLNNKIYINNSTPLRLSKQENYDQFISRANFNGGLGRFSGWRLNTGELWGHHLPMDIAVFRVYNKELSTTEISNNYNALKNCYISDTSYTVNASVGTGGTITGATAKSTSGAAVTFDVTPNSGYARSTTPVTSSNPDICPLGSFSGDEYTTGLITGNCTYTFYFASTNVAPTVTTPTATSVASSGATLGATVTSFGVPSTLTARGVCYSTIASPSPSLTSGATCVTATLAQTLTPYTVDITGLSPGTTYYFRGYATNSTGTGYTPTPNGTFTTSVSGLLANLVSYWKLDETSGTSIEDIHSTNDGTLYNATVNQTGKINKAYSFDGTGDYGTLTNSTSLSSNNSTYSLWFKSNTAINPVSGAYPSLLFKAPNTGFNREIALVFLPLSANLTANMFDGVSKTGISVNATKDYYDTQWHHVVVTKEYGVPTSNTDRLKMYIDGDLIGSSSADYHGAQNTANLEIGRTVDLAGYYFNGLIDEVGVWNRALSASEVTSLYNSGSGRSYPF